jgi:hypothetical protein
MAYSFYRQVAMFSQALVHQGSLAASENVSRTLPEDYAQQEREAGKGLTRGSGVGKKLAQKPVSETDFMASRIRRLAAATFRVFRSGSLFGAWWAARLGTAFQLTTGPLRVPVRPRGG